MDKFIKKENVNLGFDNKLAKELYFSKEYEKLSKLFIDSINNISKSLNDIFEPKIPIEKGLIDFINYFCKSFLDLFTKENFEVPVKDAFIYIRLNTTIANLLSLSALKNTDLYLSRLVRRLDKKTNFIKVLTLYSTRNDINIDYSKLFNQSKYLSSIWYWTCFNSFSYITFNGYRNYQRHLKNFEKIKEHIIIYSQQKPSYYHPYFYTTYIDDSYDPKIRAKINELIQIEQKDIQIINQVNKKKIAIISGKWAKESVVYRCQYRLIKELSKEYDLTLISTIKDQEVELSLFKKVIYCYFENNQLNIESIKKNDFCMAFYPDISMTEESLYLCNLRIAPIQLTTYGHPVSTFGSKIDYYIGGESTERSNNSNNNYSEKLLLIKGNGMVSKKPDLDFESLKEPINNPEKEYLIACSWYPNKFNYFLLDSLKKITQSSKKQIKFRFFFRSGAVIDEIKFLTMINDLESFLGAENIEIIMQMYPYQEFMEKLNECQIAISAFPFSGYVSLLDSLYIQKPTVVFQGDKTYNNFAPELFKTLELDDLIVSNSNDFIKKISKIINDDNYFLDIKQKISKIDFNKKVFLNKESTDSFIKIISKLINNEIE